MRGSSVDLIKNLRLYFFLSLKLTIKQRSFFKVNKQTKITQVLPQNKTQINNGTQHILCCPNYNWGMEKKLISFSMKKKIKNTQPQKHLEIEEKIPLFITIFTLLNILNQELCTNVPL